MLAHLAVITAKKAMKCGGRAALWVGVTLLQGQFGCKADRDGSYITQQVPAI